jgi:hypothetical protein
VVTGFLHVIPSAHAESLTSSPDALLVGRDLLVPLTEAVLTFDGSGGPVEETHEAVLINRARVAWIEALDDEALDDEPEARPSTTRARYVKDFTGSVAD